MTTYDSIIPVESGDSKVLLELLTQEQGQIYVKRENFEHNIQAIKRGDPLISIAADNEKYFDENNKIIPQRLGTEVLAILGIKKGPNEELYIEEEGGFKPAEPLIKQLISQLLENRYSGFAEREALKYIRSYLPEENIKLSSIPKLVPLDEVKAEEVAWLWEPYLSRGKICIVEGDPGLGKTFFSLAVAASISNGWPLIGKDGAMTQMVNQGKVLYLTAEDGLGDTLRPRLEKMGANVKNVIALDGKIASSKDEVTPVSLLDIEVLRNALNEVKPALIIIDPIQAYLGPNTSMSRAEEVRPILSRLGKLADEYKCAVILIRHLTKSAKDKASYRGMGSIDFTAAARSALLVGKDPNDETKRVVVQTKSSLGEPGKPIGFAIIDGKFEWLGHVEVTAAQVLAPEKLDSTAEDENSGALKEAREYLINALKDGVQPSRDIIRQIQGSGFSRRTLDRAKAALKVQSYKGGDAWYWGFPPDISEFKRKNAKQA